MPRKKGSLNRTTQETKRILNEILTNCLDTLKEDLKALKPNERINTILALFPYLLPKLRSNDQKIDFNKLNSEEIKHAVNQLLDE